MAKDNKTSKYLEKYEVLNNLSTGVCKCQSKNAIEKSSCIFCENSFEEYVTVGETCCAGNTEKCRNLSFFMKHNVHMGGYSNQIDKCVHHLIEWIIDMGIKLSSTTVNRLPEVAKYELENMERIIEMFLDKVLHCGCQSDSEKQVTCCRYSARYFMRKNVGFGQEIIVRIEKCTT